MEKTVIVANNINGTTQTVVIRDGKWYSPNTNKEWSPSLKKAYSIVSEVKPVVATNEAQTALDRRDANEDEPKIEDDSQTV